MTINPTYPELRENSDHTLSLAPVRKSNWKTGGARDYWEPHIGKFRLQYALELTAEIIADEDHPQQAAVVRGGDEKLMDLAKLAGPRDIRFSQLSIHSLGGDSIFTDYPNIIDIGGHNKRNVVIAETNEILKEFSEAITAQEFDEESYRTAAEYLGMPNCCTEFHFDNAQHHRSDPMYDIACNTDSSQLHEGTQGSALVHFPDPLLNIAWRYNGWRFIQHLPCSFECEASGDIARRNYDLLAEECGHRTTAEYLLSWLDLPFEWSGFHGLVNLKNAYGIGSYTTDDYWEEKQVIWQRPHQPKPDFEFNHPTTELEPLDPSKTNI